MKHRVRFPDPRLEEVTWQSTFAVDVVALPGQTVAVALWMFTSHANAGTVEHGSMTVAAVIGNPTPIRCQQKIITKTAVVTTGDMIGDE